MTLLSKIDALIRAGKSRQAREELLEYLKEKPKRSELAIAANLAWRCHVPQTGIQILNAIVRPSNRPTEPATDAEKIEYAACLIKIGALDEGLSLLDSAKDTAGGQVELYRSFAHINRWEYQKAIPYLEKYLTKITDPYAGIVGEINLTQAFLFEKRWDEAEKLIQDLLTRTSAEDYALARGTVLELQAARLILMKEYDRAEPILDSAATTLSQAGGTPSFLVTKWKAILNYLRCDGRDSAAKLQLSELRLKAVENSAWETARECDRFESLVSRDISLLHKLHFGTPYRSYRAHLLHDYPEVVDLPSHYAWQLGSGKGKVSYEIDLSTGDVLGAGRGTKVEKLLLKLLVALSSDFYRPFRIASLHHTLHPGEFFNPVSSPARVHRAVQRLRGFFESEKIPLDIVHNDGFYGLTGIGGRTAIHVAQSASILEGVSPELFLLQRQYREVPFSLRDAASLLKTSSRTAHRIVQRAEESGELLRLGRGKSTKYHFYKKAA